MDIPVAICTVERPRPYLWTTMASLWASDWRRSDSVVHLFVGGESADYARIHADKRVKIHPLSTEEWSEMRPCTVHARFNLNYRRCLSAVGAEGIVVLEDDLLLRPDWFYRLRSTSAELRADGRQDAVLSLYVPPGVNLVHRNGCSYRSYVAQTMYGTQAVAYFDQAAQTFLRALSQTLRTVDMALRDVQIAKQNLWAPKGSLVQHIGHTTTGLAGHMHRSNEYDQPWEGPCTP